MRYLIFFIVLSLGVSCRKAPPGQISEGSRDTLQAYVSEGPVATEVDTYFSSLARLGRFNGVVLVRSRGDLLLHKAYNMPPESQPADPGPGTADASKDSVAASMPDTTRLSASLPVRPDSQFDLRSVAKLFAKVHLLDLQRQRILDLDDPLSQYLPDFPRGRDITLRQLMEHQSGLPRELDESNLLERSPEAIVALAKRQPLEFEPGTETRYSNVGYQLLYYLIGKLSGQPFRDVMRTAYFKPLGMTGTGSNFVPEERLPPRYAFGHYHNDADSLIAVLGFLPEESRMGNFHATAGDMDRYMNALDSTLVSPLLEDGRLGHAGGTRGKRAYVLRDFAKDYSIVFLANYDGMPFEQVVADVQSLMEGGRVEMPREINRSAIALPTSVLQRYSGTYDFVDAGHIVLELRLERDTLWVYQEGRNNGPLLPESETVFFGDPESAESFEFVRDTMGTYHALMDFMGVQWKGVRIE